MISSGIFYAVMKVFDINKEKKEDQELSLKELLPRLSKL